MLTNQELYERVHRWMEKLPSQLRCPACNDHQWELRSLEETLGVVPDQRAEVPPIIPIMCRCCGHLSFFFAKAMDLT